MTDLEKKVDEAITLVKTGQERFEKLDAHGTKTDEGLEALTKDLGALGETIQQIKQAAEAHEKSMKELEEQMARMPELEALAAGAEKQVGDPAYRKQFDRYLRTGKSVAPGEDLLKSEGDRLVKAYSYVDPEGDLRELKALVLGSNPDGGFFAPVDEMRAIHKRLFETSAMRSIATVITTAREAVSVMIDDEDLSTSWVAETQTSGDTGTPGWDKLEIPTHEQQAQPKATLKMLEDSSIDLESWLMGKLMDKFARQENRGSVVGTGVNEMTGFLTKAAWTTNEQYERGKLEQITTAGSNVIAGDDLISLQTALLEPYQPNARWAMHRQTWGRSVITLKDDYGAYLMNPQMLFQGVQMMLIGKPVSLFGDMPTLVGGALPDNALAVAYGDFREGYTIVDRIGFVVLRDPYTSKGFVKFFTRKRTGGDVTNYQAIKILKIKA